jgi:hypothetical protein
MGRVDILLTTHSDGAFPPGTWRSRERSMGFAASLALGGEGD